ncbi:hypothetical protein BCR33DRAFT_751784 [Rhizoclosmatium globosum]|uniref:Uncharacterized protein n=1 Tax=Rhizoclosmatium globosum TaxID=329046 RepID=A0A1Y1ZV58_9FUNG|nr:hypothetical protein BCR33DRAFT_751784 [Rhizoclosmatium globosum]|eukprot:ORY14094.1 hypothetical protein BCR33DRAFT_751784 [Rhizoclosmatium globosum]
MTYYDFSCTLDIHEVALPSITGVGFSYKIDAVKVQNEWFGMYLTEDGEKLVFSINTNHTVIASLTFPVKALWKRDSQKSIGFVIFYTLGLVGLDPCYHATMLPIHATNSCYHATMLPCYQFMLPCYHATMLPIHATKSPPLGFEPEVFTFATTMINHCTKSNLHNEKKN